MKTLIGIDEVGRGPLAGPVTVCAVCIFSEKIILKDIFNQTIRDSKKLKKELRNNINQTIRNNSKYKEVVKFAISSRSAKFIDDHGINKAIKSSISSCLNNLKKQGVNIYKIDIQLDGGLHLNKKFKKQGTYIKGDEKFASIALASILAKVYRDNYMEKLSKKFPDYGWDKNSGYGTKKHIDSIKKYGKTEYHRNSFIHI